MTVRIYVEGGGKSSWDECRLGFAELLRKAVPEGQRPKVIPSGRRRAAYDDFRTALQQHPDDLVLLLVDAEQPVGARDAPWTHLQRSDRWRRPRRATDDSAHLMVQVMEAWLLADPRALERFYGWGFQRKVLPDRRDVEVVAKRDVFRTLQRATRQTLRGVYHKTRHGFALLAEIDPHKVCERAAHFARLCRRLEAAR